MKGIIFKNIQKLLLLNALVSCALATAVFAAASRDSNSDIAVIVSHSTPVSNLSLAELRAILSGDRKSWDRKTPAMVLMRASGSREQAVILDKVLKQSESDYKKFWVGKIFRGEATTQPPSAPSPGLALDYVSNVDGAISFVNISQTQSRVKILRINGKLPGEDGYPLQ